LYQSNIGDYDNMSLFGNLKLQYPKLGFIWFSLFLDEANFENNFFNLGREMYAIQAGLQYKMSFLPSGLLTLSYTKIEPYCYTHQKTIVPGYSRPMEQAYINHGYGLGYYLPPNSDELKLAAAANAAEQTEVNFQFQMIRHGAEYGEHKVFGSSYYSELQENDRSTDPRLRKDFLKDGAYQWFFVLKAGGKHSIKGIPAAEKLQMEFLLDAGAVFSYWQLNYSSVFERALEHKDYANRGRSLNENEYPTRYGIIMDAGFRIKY
jgi:hypothetical protein